MLRLQDIQLAFGGFPLLDQLSLNIEKGERISLIGRNGAGKSTLLKVIEGSLPYDSGERIVQSHVVISQLAQEVPEDIHASVFDVVAGGLDGVGALLTEYHHLSINTDVDNWMEKLERLQQQIEDKEGWKLQQQVDATLSRLDLPAEAEFSALSGGLKRRVLLARALLQEPDILLLDEPTNHLDIEAIQWLEEFLLTFRGAILFITHDRTFLKNLATRIIELDRGQITSFPGDFANYLRRKEEMLHAEDLANAQFDKKLAQEEVWIRQGIKARRTRNEGRVRALEKMRSERSQRRNQQGDVKLNLTTENKSGKIVVDAENIAFTYPDKAIVNDLTMTIMRGDKVGILGPNGAGKTTLLKLLLGQQEPQSGTVKLGTNIELAYFDQLREELDLEQNVRDNLDLGSDQVTVNGKQRHVISYLQDFLFTPERIHSPVRTLSGGERNRLLLAKLFLKPANMLVMDEPTNDLDIETLELLEELLLDYSGTLLLVSHDRSFINNLVTSTLVLEGKGNVHEYVGGYNDWLRQRDHKLKAATALKTTAEHKQPKKPQAKKVAKLSYKDQRELELLPKQIEALEADIQRTQDDMGSAEFYKKTPEDIANIQKIFDDKQNELEVSYARWEELEEKRDALS
ncbi:MAG: COG0488: ATPase components of ABC transporters with duplicated ATPase domains [uncultured Thiotrichaceae bacterium]|uniref:ATP-binding protein Uup n=1 Tax=uncultured Thiotrichaceae bacterium TaxID=298394 RepID=A0A6S6U3X6_9GAMM|nr:MAG: COG0488: ATPase components of ABC transporters with duplicated ATPase domains [uncultured Thiotrichaceae bacterium]